MSSSSSNATMMILESMIEAKIEAMATTDDVDRAGRSSPERDAEAAPAISGGTFAAAYVRDRRLQSGSYGTVYTCRRRCGDGDGSSSPSASSSSPSGQTTWAVKVWDRTKLKAKDDGAVFREVALLQRLRDLSSSHIIRVRDFYVEPERLYLVTQYAAGGDVFDRLRRKSQYTELDARELARVLLATVNALHTHRPHPVVHRDLKPENLLLESPIDDLSLLLCDFGFARTVPANARCRTRCGTPSYTSPEIVLGVPYGTETDVWSAGCVLYVLLSGYLPFAGSNHRELFRRIRAADYMFHDRVWRGISAEAKRLVSHMLTVNVQYRSTGECVIMCTVRAKCACVQSVESRCLRVRYISSRLL
jgi:serine/threonine protein kinase